MMVMDRSVVKKTAGILAFFRALGHRWFTLMSGPLTVPFAALAFYLDQVWQKTLFGLLAILSASAAFYFTWRVERLRAGALEEQLSEIRAPEAQIALVRDDREYYMEIVNTGSGGEFSVRLRAQGHRESADGFGMWTHTSQPATHIARGDKARIHVATMEMEPAHPSRISVSYGWAVHVMRDDRQLDVRPLYRFNLEDDPDSDAFGGTRVVVEASVIAQPDMVTGAKRRRLIFHGTAHAMETAG